MFLNYVAKPTKTLSAFPRITELLSFNKRKTLFKAFVEFQFKYCPII